MGESKGGTMDSLGEMSEPFGSRGDSLSDHPDLNALGRRLRLEMDETLRAEQYAARVSAQRRSTIRDRFLLAEDRAEPLNVEMVGGSDIHGVVVAVGVDHVVVADRGRHCWVAMQHVVAIRVPAP